MSALCIEHTLARDRQGYARTSLNGQLTGLHRKVYCQTRSVTLADIADLVVRHTCDNPSCIEPTHLLLGTRGDNNRDRAERGRSADRNGEAHPLSVLKGMQVREIRRLFAAGGITQKRLAVQFHCDPSNISRIIKRDTWSKV